MSLQPATLNQLDTYWAAFFGCSSATLAARATLVVPHAQLGEYHGIWLFRHADTLIVSLPLAVDPDRFVMLTPADFGNVAALLRHVAMPVERVVGPAFIGYADESTLRPCHDAAARLLTPQDQEAYAALRAACSAIEWEHGGSSFEETPLAGYFVDDQLAALAGYRLWGTNIAHIAVVAHPAFRGQGCAKRAVSLLATTVLRAGLIAQYRTLGSNTPSLRVAAQLGFVPYAESLALRLVPPV